MQVLKFGGSSVANAENITKVAAIVSTAVQKGATTVVVSALGGITDALLQCARTAAAGNEDYKQMVQTITTRHIEEIKKLLPLANQSSTLSFAMQRCNEVEDICNGVFLLSELSARTKDRITSYGEWLSSKIIADYFIAVGIDCCWADARTFIVTDDHYTKAAVDFEQTNKKINAFFENNNTSLYIIPGFIAADEQGNTTTLGRGGSDYTAAIVGAALNVKAVEIWTDVSGMMTADPRLVANAKSIPHISYAEAMELSHFGAKVIYPPTIQPLMNHNIAVWIKNTFAPQDSGTQIQATQNSGTISGISSINNIALLSLEGSGMVGIPGFSKRLFEVLANHGINVILITQSSSEHSICVGVEAGSAPTAKLVVDKAFSAEIKEGIVNALAIETNLAIIALVGDNMKNHVGTSGKMFSALGQNGINIRAIAQGSSERNISAVIAAADVKKGTNVLHEAFFETTYKQLNLFIAGAGNVGAKLLAQLYQQQQYLAQHLRLQVRVVGLANSKKMIFKDEGLSLQHWKEELAAGENKDEQLFVNTIREKNLRNAVFIDVTANESVTQCYQQLFEKSISVIACNKIAPSASYGVYKKLKEMAREYQSLFLFETNVGAGLPVIGTLNDLLRSGDVITRIEAVLSGTLNFVFNHYDGTASFASVVRKAQEEGYTEPDPRLDLSGTDVMRKILILAREAGEVMEMDSITNNTFMPQACMQGSIEDFYNTMEKEEPHFKQLFSNAHAAGKKLKYVASYNNGKASVGLQQVDAQHDFYHLYGKDNVVLFYTHRYPQQPLVIKGAGAGAEVTASGVFADIIRAARL